MYTSLTFIYFAILMGFILPAGATVIEISETDGPGTVLTTVTGRDNCNVSSTDPNLNDEYFIFDNNNNTGTIADDDNNLILIEPLDLEVLTQFTEFPADLYINYTCSTDDQTLHVRIIPVNEFDPIFINSPYHTNITENMVAGTGILYLDDKCSDSDRIKYGRITRFQLHPYQISAFDGRRFIYLDESIGIVSTSVMIDYDSLPRNFFMLNISVWDDGGRSSVTSVNVTVIDIDDNGPYFTTCSRDRSCQVKTYTAKINKLFLGTLQVTPSNIQAVDGDHGINARIKYSLDSSDRLVDNLQIDPATGRLEVLEPFYNYTNLTMVDPFILVVNITAEEVTQNARTTQIELVIDVHDDVTTTSPSIINTTMGSTELPKPASKEFDYLLVIEIAVPVCVVFIVLIIVIVCLVKKKQKLAKEARYQVDEHVRDKNRNADEHNTGHIDFLSSTPINPYELSNVYARITSGSGYEIIEVMSRDDGTSDTHVLNKRLSALNKECGDKNTDDPNAMKGNENESDFGYDVNSDVNPTNLYAVVKKSKSKMNKALQEFANSAVYDTADGMTEDDIEGHANDDVTAAHDDAIADSDVELRDSAESSAESHEESRDLRDGPPLEVFESDNVLY
ncbi:hypothetical protein ACF0H5_023183 [Mactra antiquata]